MELRVGIQEGMLDRTTHRVMKMIVSYISSMYELQPALMDLEGGVFDDIDKELCHKIVDDIKMRFRRHMRYIEIECL
jgi:hypothetical protein